MRLLTASLLTVCLLTSALAHHPDKEHQPVHPRIDVIPPSVHSWLPMSDRRKYNRPSNISGRIMYHIAPSSQEAMAWHNATHRGYYENDRPRIVMHYFYPKPWESIQIGARPKTAQEAVAAEETEEVVPAEVTEEAVPAEATEPAEEVLSEQPAEAAALEDPPALPAKQPIAAELELIEG